jgi:general L-amino acid transport system permease protein
MQAQARRWRWRDASRQALAFAVLAGLLLLMFRVTSANLQARGIESGFAFLWKPATTPVFESPLAFEAGVDTFARAFAAGALNSLKLTLAAIVAATVIGVAVGLGRLARNPLARALCGGYVEVMRNVPVLLHVFLWYALILELPAASAFPTGSPVLPTNRGLHLAWFAGDVNWPWSIGLTAAAVAAMLLMRRRTKAHLRPASAVTALAMVIAACLLPWVATGRLPPLEIPAIDGFEVAGGLALSPEFSALFLGISLYTAAFIAEIVRAAVGSIERGQWEAAAALDLSRSTTLRRVVFPQAFRVGAPSITSEYLGIFKNSTLAVAVGYQDFMAVSNTMLTDTGQAVEVMAIVMLFYAAVSLLASAAMHVFEHRSMRWGAK